MSQVQHSVCPLDCPDTCSLAVTVEGDDIVKVRGSYVNPLTHGTICGKVSHYPEFVHGPDRLLYPLKRVGAKGQGEFRRISWDEALDLVASKMSGIKEEHGPDAFGLFSSSRSTNELNYLAGKFVRQVLGNSNIDSCNRA